MAATVIARVGDRTVRDRRWDTLRRAAATRLAPFGAAVLLLAVAAALLAPVVAPHDPLKQDLNHTLGRPDRVHPLGTDNVGRDVLSRVIWGTRVSLVAGFGSVVIAVVVGGVLGLAAGYAGGRVDNLIMRVVDAVLSFPPLVLALALGAVLGAGLSGVVIALGVVYTPTFARLMRGQVLSVKTRDYVEAARALGSPAWRIARQHVLPNAATPIVVQASLSVAFAILAEASLSFLGLGVQPPAASWGSESSVSSLRRVSCSTISRISGSAGPSGRSGDRSSSIRCRSCTTISSSRSRTSSMNEPRS